MSSTNAKNRLKELLESLGWSLETRACFTSVDGGNPRWSSEVVVELPERGRAVGTGRGHQKAEAEIAACADVLPKLAGEELDIDRFKLEAQAGDALIKLAAYRDPDKNTAHEASLWLQAFETNRGLAVVYDRWRDAGLPAFQRFGPGLGEEAKAALVEAEVWRRFASRVIQPEAEIAWVELRTSLTATRGNQPD